MPCPERLETPRLSLDRPRLDDAPAIFARYSSDANVTRFLSFRCHTSVADAETFVRISDDEWTRNGYGPYLIRTREGGILIGGTGIHRRDAGYVETGYLLAKDAWGRGYATEGLQAMVSLARDLAIARLVAHCHIEHRPSAHVLEKCGFVVAGIVTGHFPNLAPPAAPAMRYERDV